MPYRNKVWMITGGTGSFASHAIPHILEHYEPREIVIFSRDEYKQYQMRKDADGRLRFEIGDVRDAQRIYRAMKGVDYVIHAAALKHVHTGEANPLEVIKTNIAGTQNVVDASNGRGARMVLLSTDKACEPINAYGASKMLAERVTLAGNQVVVRYGNVIGSRGSVFDVFRKMAEQGEFTVTDMRCTRFGVTFDYAIGIACHALSGEYQEPALYVSKAGAFSIVDLVDAFDTDAPINERGLTPGEKLHETLMTGQEAARAIEMGWYYYVPEDVGGKMEKLDPYTSDTAPRYSVQDLREMVEAL
jgi:UDP-N-acetylglucosamine 4,6-dehydratase